MARLPRLVLPGHPYHVTQRGYRRERVIFEDGDYELYLDKLSGAADVSLPPSRIYRNSAEAPYRRWRGFARCRNYSSQFTRKA